MATKTAKPAKKAAAPKGDKEKASYAVDKNWLLKRFHKTVAKTAFPDDANYGDRLKFKKALHGAGTIEKTRSFENVTPELFDAALTEFFKGFEKDPKK
jgi:hypothetical protein